MKQLFAADCIIIEYIHKLMEVKIIGSGVYMKIPDSHDLVSLIAFPQNRYWMFR